MAARLRSDSLHPCHHLSEPLRNMFWCRHCMKIFTDPIDRWRHSKTCREDVQGEDGSGVSKQLTLKEGTLFRFGVWDADTVISRPKSQSSSKKPTQYGIRIPGSGKVAGHRSKINPQNFDLQCVICRKPFKSIDEMRIHVKTPCSKATAVPKPNRFPPEISTVLPSTPPKSPAREVEKKVVEITKEEDIVSLPIGHWTEPVFPINTPVNDKFQKTTMEPELKEDGAIIKGLDEPDGNSVSASVPKAPVISDDCFQKFESVVERDACRSGVFSNYEAGGIVELDGKIPTVQLTPLVMPIKNTLPFSRSDLMPGIVEKFLEDNPVSKTKTNLKTKPCKSFSSNKTGTQQNMKISQKNSSKMSRERVNVSQKKRSNQNNRTVGKVSHERKRQIVFNALKNTPTSKKACKEPEKLKIASAETQPKTHLDKGKGLVTKETVAGKPPRPRKCKICGRFYKSLELLQRHNRIPCRVKLTRNVCAKVLRSKSQSSDKENGQRPGRVSKLGPSKLMLKRGKRQKKPKKRWPPPFRGNPKFPQYRLVFADLSEKEQFFFRLDLIPNEVSQLKRDNAKVETLADSFCDTAQDALTTLEVKDSVVEDEHLSPPKLEKMAYIGTALMDDREEYLEPPELDLINLVTDTDLDTVPPSEFSLTSAFEPTTKDELKTKPSPQRKGTKVKGKRKQIETKACKDPYSILHPMAKNSEKSRKTHTGGGIVCTASRASLRLKKKALAKVLQETGEQISRDTSKILGDSMAAGDEKHLKNIEKSATKVVAKSRSSRDETSLSCQQSKGYIADARVATTPRKGLFDTLIGISKRPTDEALPVPKNKPAFCSKESQKKVLENLRLAKSRLGKILSPTKRAANVESPRKPKETVNETQCVSPNSENSRKRGRKMSTKRGVRKWDSLGGISDLGNKTTAIAGPSNAKRVSSRKREEFSDERDTVLINKSTDMTASEPKKTKPSIRLPLLASRGAPPKPKYLEGKKVLHLQQDSKRHAKHHSLKSSVNKSVGEKRSTNVSFVQTVVGGSTPGLFRCNTPRGSGRESVGKASYSGECAKDVLGTFVQPCPILPSPAEPESSKLNQLFNEESALNSGVEIQDLIPLKNSEIECAPVLESVSVQYIDQLNDLSKFTAIAVRTDVDVEEVVYPIEEGYSCTADSTDLSDIQNYSKSVEIFVEENQGIDIEPSVVTIDPQFQAIQF